MTSLRNILLRQEVGRLSKIEKILDLYIEKFEKEKPKKEKVDVLYILKNIKKG